MTNAAVLREFQRHTTTTTIGQGNGSNLPFMDVAMTGETYARSYGANIHSTWSGPSSFTSDVVALINDCGLRVVRDHMAPGNSHQRTTFTTMNAQAHTNIGDFNNSTLADAQNAAAEIAGFYGGAAGGVFRSVGGINEPNDSTGGRRADWATITVKQTKWMWDSMKADPTTRSISVMAPGLRDVEPTLQQDYITLKNAGINQYIDHGDLHHYQGGNLPDFNLDQRIGYSQAGFVDSGGNPYPSTMTEGGYNTGLTTTKGPNGTPVNELAQAIYLLRLWAEVALRGIWFFTQYELLDKVMANGSTDLQEWENNFGIVFVDDPTDPNTWTPKQAYTGIQNMLALVGEPSNPTFTPTQLQCEVDYGQSDLRKLLLQKSNGKWYMLLWRNQVVYTGGRTGHDVPVTPVNATLLLANSLPVKHYKPTSQSSAVNTWSANTTFTVPLDGEIAVLQIG